MNGQIKLKSDQLADAACELSKREAEVQRLTTTEIPALRTKVFLLMQELSALKRSFPDIAPATQPVWHDDPTVFHPGQMGDRSLK